MGRSSENRFKFSKPNLSALERRIDRGAFPRGGYLYDSESHLALRVRPGQSYTECAFYLYERIKVAGETRGRAYKRHLMGVGEARNAKVTLTELRQRADSLFLEIQEGRDPQLLARQAEAERVAEEALVEAKRSLREMIFGMPSVDNPDLMVNGFVSERRPSASYLSDINYLPEHLLGDLMAVSLHAISAEQVKTVYLDKVDRGETQLHNALRILRSVWNWAQTKYDDSDLFVRNPVSRVMKQLGVNINRTNRRTVRLDDIDIKPYLKAVLALRERDHTSALRNGRDALLFMLFSGVRLAGCVSVRLEDIDIDRRCYKIIKKGGAKAELPLNSVTEALVANRLSYLPEEAEYLFPGIAGRSHYRNTSPARAVVKELSGVAVTNHDLRRTYKTIGAELDINPVLIDELLCHARDGVDAHYIHPSMTKLQQASQQIADHIVKKAGFDVVGELLKRW